MHSLDFLKMINFKPNNCVYIWIIVSVTLSIASLYILGSVTVPDTNKAIEIDLNDIALTSEKSSISITGIIDNTTRQVGAKYYLYNKGAVTSDLTILSYDIDSNNIYFSYNSNAIELLFPIHQDDVLTIVPSTTLLEKVVSSIKGSM